MASFVLRAVGHGLFTGLIALLFACGYFSRMRWIDAGAHDGIAGWMVRYGEFIVQILWTLGGLILAALIHTAINIFSALGGESIAIILLMLLWSILLLFLARPSTAKQYGVIIKEVDLLRTIVDAEQNLQSLERQTRIQPGNTPLAPLARTLLKKVTKPSSKQFAKT